MATRTSPRTRRGPQPLRRLSFLLIEWGLSSEKIAIFGMALGISGGVAFMATSLSSNAILFWWIGLGCCFLRVICLRVDSILHQGDSREQVESADFNELPERVSDAVNLIGFGFAAGSDPWLGLGAALLAIFSAYIRSIGFLRGVRKKDVSTGPMTRIHRLALLTLTALWIALGFSEKFATRTPVPQIALWIIIGGCALTILLRWNRIRKAATS
ncbi:MAG: hypothetical protein AAF357_00040 [Verrucomicrobiota bacterium]